MYKEKRFIWLADLDTQEHGTGFCSALAMAPWLLASQQ